MSPQEFDPGPLAEVEHHTEGGRSTLVFVRHLRHAPARVWAALTDPAQLRQWAPFGPDRDLATVGPATLRMTDGQNTEEFAAEVRRVVAPRLLEYTWGEDLLRWELAPEGAGSHRLRHGTGPGRRARPIEELARDGRLDGSHRIDAVRAHLLEMSGDNAAAVDHYRAEAARTTNLPERDYLLTQAARLEADPAAG